MSLSVLFGLQLLPQKSLCKVLDCIYQLCIGSLAILRACQVVPDTSRKATLRLRSLLTITEAWALSLHVDTGTQMPTF